MATPEVSKLRLKGSVDDATQAILEALPEDAIVRDEDDGVGRYAGDRILVVRSREDARLAMFFGTYGSIKGRLEKPHLDVVFSTTDKGTSVRLVREAEKPPTVASRVLDFIGNAVTVALVVVAYHMFRSIPVDQQLTAIIAVVGGAIWTGLGILRPKKEDRRLEELVRTALAPMTRRKKKKPPAEVEAEPEPEPEPEPPDRPDAGEARTPE